MELVRQIVVSKRRLHSAEWSRLGGAWDGRARAGGGVGGEREESGAAGGSKWDYFSGCSPKSSLNAARCCQRFCLCK